MELNILEKKKNRLIFELEGADHTLCNALKVALWEDSDVKVATYTIKHPLLAVPKFIIETKSKDADKALITAIGKVKKDFKAFGTALAKV
ncbi:DNA-directed RNA polymerase subunit L [Candidatus Woesearchaeota archaeon]|nr:DNA-directed RNA polymerase subunit L [Candidatus Woesearchaeota archaeon]